MLKIDRLRLTLPAGFEGRARSIARRLAEELARPLPAGASGQRLARLEIPPLTVGPEAGDRQIARRLADNLHARLCQRKEA